jgi:hypothetical protein
MSDRTPHSYGSNNRLDYFNCVAAIIGCITDVLALGWQFWTATREKQGKVTLQCSTSETWKPGVVTVVADITNFGERDVYIKSVLLQWKDESPGLNGRYFTSPNSAESPLAVGAYRRFTLPGLSISEIERLIKTDGDLTVVASTSRGRAFTRNIREDLSVTLWSDRIRQTHLHEAIDDTK